MHTLPEGAPCCAVVEVEGSAPQWSCGVAVCCEFALGCGGCTRRIALGMGSPDLREEMQHRVDGVPLEAVQI